MVYFLNFKQKSFFFVYKVLWRNYGNFYKKNIILSDSFPQERSIIVLRKQRSKFRYNVKSLVQPLEEKSLELLSQKLIYGCPNRMIDTSMSEIDKMKPNNTLVSHDFFDQIVKNIEFSFNRKQIQKYAQFNGLKNMSSSSRSQLIKRILKEVWKLQVSSDICSDIFMVKEIRSNKRDIFFITRLNGLILRQWELDYQAKIYIDFDRLVLQVKAARSNIEKLEMEMIKMAERINIEDIDIEYLSKSSYFNDIYISEISSLTETFIEKISVNRIRIMTLGNQESLEDAKRLLYMLLTVNDHKSYSLIYDNSQSNNSFYYFGEKFSLPLFLRKKEWVRWRSILNKDKNIFFKKEFSKKLLESKYKVAIENGFIKSNSDLTLMLYDVPAFFDNYVTYSTIFSKRTYYDITFGYILHDFSLKNVYKQSFISGLMEHFEENQKNYMIPKIFCSNISHASMFIYKLKSNYKDRFLNESYKKIFRLKFVPSPRTCLSINGLPYIEIDLEMDHKGDFSDIKVKYVFDENILDVLLPQCRNDIRIFKKVFFFLDLNNKSLMAYLNKICLSSMSIDKLQTSSVLYLDLPLEFKNIYKIQEYVLVTVEYINQSDFKFNKFLLRLLNIEGNTHSGRRIELKLLFLDFGKDFLETVLSSQDWEDFINDANIIVNELSRLFNKMFIDQHESPVFGTKDYWDSIFKNELENFESFKDVGEIWFGKGLENKIIDWLKKNIPPHSNLRVLDIGCGNGHFLCSLSNKGYESCTLVGIDYSNIAIELSKNISNEQGVKNITFKTLDILDFDDYFNGEWDIVLDKGTFDSISLNTGVNGRTRMSLLYLINVKKLIKKDGFFIITSCNWTKEELISNFSSQDLIYYSYIETPILSFGGSHGSRFSTVIFVRQ
ncbi:hypothetical protein PMAC_001990 [Pneumocystis sp. 'macacae']|nr:hypothetical protein PMAC_001990 [Pneumocystis sp. 'macacae']